MKLLLDIAKVQFTVSLPAKEKVDQNGRPKLERGTGAPLWVTQLMALDASGADVLNVTVAGEMPKVTVGQIVHPAELEALPWSQGERSGVAYRAKQLTLVQPQKS